ncbi:MAG: lysophospholipid acyltransferase family protein [Candidatus Electronema sp. V4]|uniref:lysophospholipid acyltransferase family protein n=1 Tax=Candidatus Electronema sp. V4 TaxID=3454756 RepID=UPI00405569FB
MIPEPLWNALADSLLWLFWVPFRKTLHLLPKNAAYAVADGLAWAASILLKRLRRDIAAELAELLPDRSAAERDAIAADSIRLDILRRIEETFMGTFTAETAAAAVSIEGEEFLRQAAQGGKGTIILLSHFGSFLMILPALAFRGYAVNQLAGPPELKHHRWINQLVFRIREQDYARLPVRFLRADLHIKTMLQALKNNELTAMAVDGRISSSWVPVQFFGRTAWFAPGPVKIAQKTGAAIVPTFIIRERRNHHRLILSEPVRLEQAADEAAFLQTNMQRLAALLERMIEKHPAHFAMIFHINRKRGEQSVERGFFV